MSNELNGPPGCTLAVVVGTVIYAWIVTGAAKAGPVAMPNRIAAVILRRQLFCIMVSPPGRGRASFAGTGQVEVNRLSARSGFYGEIEYSDGRSTSPVRFAIR